MSGQKQCKEAIDEMEKQTNLRHTTLTKKRAESLHAAFRKHGTPSFQRNALKREN